MNIDTANPPFRKPTSKRKSPGITLFITLLVLAAILLQLAACGPAQSVIDQQNTQTAAAATSTAAPTKTHTATPMPPTNTPTATPTVTNTPTITPTPTQAGPSEYIIQKDDTSCWSIAEKLGLSTELFNVLLSLNDCSLIREGYTILIPAPWQTLPTETPLPPDIASGTLIQIKAEAGASFRSIAQAYNSTIDRILLESNKYRRANGLTLWTEDSPLLIDDVVMVPVNIVTPTPLPSATATVFATPTLSGPSAYVVQEGDLSCWSISEKLGLSADRYAVMLTINDCSIIRVGDTILIPPAGLALPTETPLPTDIAPGTVITVTVESGASFRSIALAYKSTVDRILIESNKYRRANGLTAWTEDSPLYIGDLVKVPYNIVTPTPTPTVTRTLTPTATK